ncbi:endonuclease/exonuclease/phosphatase family protein [Anaerosacchariphilus polymeriproducens]|uniref:Endonuclease/exonuclease/phosphatase family protein n=1 Tax=Anaerosacchariphilus polymeriproducens TaxID=1812858 RepID=A0A371AYV8_9FIRM|nr:endonuclease/exonuclease/phosphatase family protein [Anaerosacchariphilus polymeriproducens]RDU24660.1 endonuclease/exonuclease/phosphatase family protein [Anaerosacchariphilus polymeriproducens]
MKTLKVGSFNLYNLVLPNHTYYDNNSYSDIDYKKKLEWIRSQVQTMDAQIIGFQEIFHKEALVAALDNTQFNSEQIHVLGETGSSPVVGLASQFPVINEPESIENIPTEVTKAINGLPEEFKKFSRAPLKVKLSLPEGINITVIVCHLKSKRPIIMKGEDDNDLMIQALGETRSLLRRSIESSGIRKIVLDEISNNNNPLILIGDLNDSTRSVTTNIIAGPSPWKFDPIEVKKQHWDCMLYSVFDIISQKSFKTDWPTYIYNGHYEELDHILLSQEFFFRNQERIGDLDFVHILDDHLIDNTLSKDKLPKWQSDHGQVVATIRFIT